MIDYDDVAFIRASGLQSHLGYRGLLNKRREEKRKFREKKKALRIKMTARGECAYHTTAVTTYSCTYSSAVYIFDTNVRP